MKKQNIFKKIASMMLTLKLILLLNNNWEEYKKCDRYKKREVEIKEVEKMLNCMDPEGGYSIYKCIGCGETKVIPHSCKSRICSTCGKKHADEWSEKINKEMYAVPYRHVILTISDKLWPYFEGNAKLQKLMLDTAAKVMKEIIKNYNKKKKAAEAGIIMVLHPFGRDLKTNMHVHMLITEGGLTKAGEWIEMPYIDYGIIRKKWQYEILTELKNARKWDSDLAKIIDWCFKNRTKGFNIQAKRRIEGTTKNAARYMARYVRHPAIADSRIIGYDTKEVTFVYERDGVEKTVIMDKYEFIHSVIKHIPDENFKMVRYYGIHGRRAIKYTREKMNKLGLLVKYIIKPFEWRNNLKKYTGKDPLKCEECECEMILFKVVYRNREGCLKEYGGDIDKFKKKAELRRMKDSNEKKEAKKYVQNEDRRQSNYYQVCMF